MTIKINIEEFGDLYQVKHSQLLIPTIFSAIAAILPESWYPLSEDRWYIHISEFHYNYIVVEMVISFRKVY